ncbi:DNA repair protein RAD51 homolog 2 isoform X2 [Andrographis paniculata]|uniref:DNA repair protein RAD51 homolog 2 isoform X2 n=1 Tax=Andrographis paniculata TaxID=175694 RepID=UPI0021E7C2CA|nr:DNA repair protein RAD51 homolog 2 isoform X2 [Andrographis paniculata]
MANKLIREMGLPGSIANVFAARNIITAKDALSLSEFELMELLDMGLEEVALAVAHISEISCPPYQTALSLLDQKNQNEHFTGHLPTHLKGLDAALCGGIPSGVVTELVGPAGIGKTQLALLASLPTSYGGLGGCVMYIDVESKFSSRRMIEMGISSFPEIFRMEGLAQEMAGRVLILRPESLSDFTESLQQIKVSLLQHHVKLLIIDSMAALMSGEYDQGAPRHHHLGWHISFIKSLAEFSQIPVVVTNQVRSQGHDEVPQYLFQVQCRDETVEDPPKFDSHLVAALGINWAHAVSIRLVLEYRSAQRFIKIAKSPKSPSVGFFFNITACGISLLNDESTEILGPEANTIHSQGSIINY